ncbi:MAG: hypothetical protein ACI8ZN_001683 [Bacteroidia bacterium]|jgi:hypothetical protein
MEILRKIWSYITFKKDTENPNNTFIKSMHRINKLSILMFLVAIIVLIMRYFR